LPDRVEGEVTTQDAERIVSTQAAVAALTRGGALVASVASGEDDADRTACLFWIGAAGVVIHEAGKAIESLSDDEVATLDQSLRLYVEEGGEEDEPPFEWSPLERVSSDDTTAALREAGVSDPCELIRLGIQVGEVQFAFLFVSTPQSETVASPSKARGAESQSGAPSTPSPAAAPPVTASVASPAAVGPDTGPGPNLQHLLNVRMPLTVRLGSTKMNLGEILRLTQGSIVELEQREEAPLEVLANGHVIARGEVVVVDERFGLRITEIGSSSERIRATV
jgi:flagellar motor switch protein FliN/FliY